MEIFTLLETLEDIVEKSKSVPFTEKAIVDKEEILEIVKEIRLKLPDELKQAKWIKEERERILKEAQKELKGFKIEYSGDGETVTYQEPKPNQYIKETNIIKLMLE